MSEPLGDCCEFCGSDPGVRNGNPCFCGNTDSVPSEITESDALAELSAAAKAVVARWDSPDWSDWMHTADYINRLRKAVEGMGEQA